MSRVYCCAVGQAVTQSEVVVRLEVLGQAGLQAHSSNLGTHDVAATCSTITVHSNSQGCLQQHHQACAERQPASGDALPGSGPVLPAFVWTLARLSNHLTLSSIPDRFEIPRHLIIAIDNSATIDFNCEAPNTFKTYKIFERKLDSAGGGEFCHALHAKPQCPKLLTLQSK